MARTQLRVNFFHTNEEILEKFDEHDAALDGVDGGIVGYNDGDEAVLSGACSIVLRSSRLEVDNTQAFTLADGTFQGQRKVLICTVATDTPAGTLTPASPLGFSTILFNAVGEMAELEWNVAEDGWFIVSVNGATPS